MAGHLNQASHSVERLRYDPGEHRRKHCWQQSHADFENIGVAVVGKCPSTLSKAVAEQLLNDAVFEGEHPLPPIAQAMPDRVWNVHEGVVYEAVCPAPGVYHGYPWCGRPGRNRLARPVKRALLEKARQQGCAAAVEDWFKKYES